MAGSLEHLQPDAAELNGLAVSHRRERVVGLRTGAQMDLGAGAIAKLEMAGDEIGVKVRKEHVADPAAEPVGVLEILVDVALGVDDSRLANLRIGDQVGGVGEAAEVVLLQDQG